MPKLNSLQQASSGMPSDDMVGLASWNTMFATAQTWGRQVAETGAACQREWASFVERRLKEDLALGDRIAKAKGLDDVSRLYTDFFRTAVEDYQHQFATLSRLGAEAAQPAVDTIAGRTNHQDDDRARRDTAIVTH